MKERKSLWSIILNNIIRNLVLAVISLGGIITVIADIAKDFLPNELKTAITFLTALISFFTVLVPTIEYYVTNMHCNDTYAIVEDILKAYGITMVHRKRSSGNKLSATSCKKELLEVAADSMRKAAPRQIDSDKELRTDYYIYTLSAAHVEEKLEVMAKYMGMLIDQIQNEVDKKTDNSIQNVYVLIVPYGRNVILGEKLANLKNVPILISQLGKIETDSLLRTEDDPYEIMYSQFIGMDSLESYVQKIGKLNDPNKKRIEIIGIIVDCNTTKGSAYINIVKYFNEKLLAKKERICETLSAMTNNKMTVNIQDLKYCATMFIASDNAIPTCKKQFCDNGCDLYYYFRLTEEAKALLYANREELSQIEVSQQILQRCAESCGFNESKRDDVHELVKKLSEWQDPNV